MPVHQRAKSYQRAASLPPSSPPLSMRPSNASRDRQRRTPIVPSARRQRLLQTTAAVSAFSYPMDALNHFATTSIALTHVNRNLSLPTLKLLWLPCLSEDQPLLLSWDPRSYSELTTSGITRSKKRMRTSL